MNYKRLREQHNYDLVPHSFYHEEFEDGWIGSAAHCHPYLEIMYCRKGEFLLEIVSKDKNGKNQKTERIPIKEKQFVFLDAGTIHGVYVEEKKHAFVSNLEWKIEPRFNSTKAVSGLVSIDAGSFFDQFEGLRRFLNTPQGYVIALDSENVEHNLVYYINLANSRDDSTADECRLQARLVQLLIELNKSLSSFGISTGISYIKRAQSFIKNNFNRPITVDDVAADTGITKGYLQRLFNAHTGMSVLQYLNNFRITKCKKILLETNLSIDEICCHVGFNNRQQLIYEFKAQLGMTPTAYRNDFINMTQRYTPPTNAYISSDVNGNPIF